MVEHAARTPRLRMFAGPNGSGKSTLKVMLSNDLLGVYINPDDIQKQLGQFGFLDLHHGFLGTQCLFHKLGIVFPEIQRRRD